MTACDEPARQHHAVRLTCLTLVAIGAGIVAVWFAIGVLLVGVFFVGMPGAAHSPDRRFPLAYIEYGIAVLPLVIPVAFLAYFRTRELRRGNQGCATSF